MRVVKAIVAVFCSANVAAVKIFGHSSSPQKPRPPKDIIRALADFSYTILSVQPNSVHRFRIFQHAATMADVLEREAEKEWASDEVLYMLDSIMKENVEKIDLTSVEKRMRFDAKYLKTQSNHGLSPTFNSERKYKDPKMLLDFDVWSEKFEPRYTMSELERWDQRLRELWVAASSKLYHENIFKRRIEDDLRQNWAKLSIAEQTRNILQMTLTMLDSDSPLVQDAYNKLAEFVSTMLQTQNDTRIWDQIFGNMITRIGNVMQGENSSRERLQNLVALEVRNTLHAPIGLVQGVDDGAAGHVHTLRRLTSMHLTRLRLSGYFDHQNYSFEATSYNKYTVRRLEMLLAQLETADAHKHSSVHRQQQRSVEQVWDILLDPRVVFEQQAEWASDKLKIYRKASRRDKRRVRSSISDSLKRAEERSTGVPSKSSGPSSSAFDFRRKSSDGSGTISTRSPSDFKRGQKSWPVFFRNRRRVPATLS